MGICRFFSVLWLSATFLVPAASGALGEDRGGTLTYAMYDDIKDWDPAIAFSLEVIMLVNVYEPLVWYDPANEENPFEPGLAKSWSSNDEGTEWTFTLREDVRFHDGTPLTASAAKASLERTISMRQGASYIWDPVTEILAPDAHTLIIRTDAPTPIDLIAASQYAAYIYSPTAAQNGTDWFNQGNAAGTGPYRVRQWARGQQVVLESFDDYWGGIQDGQFHRIILRVVREAATQSQLIRSGEADIISLAPIDVIEALRERDDITILGASSWLNSQFLLNTSQYPTDNLEFRRALTHAWDYTTVTESIYAGLAQPSIGAIPRTMWGHDPDLEMPLFDLTEAHRLLIVSGIPRRDWHLTASYIGTSSEYANALLLFQSYLANLGVTLELNPGPWETIWGDARDLRTAPNIISMTWWPTYPTPADWLRGLFVTEEDTLFNLSHYSNEEFDRLVEEGRTLEGSDRAAAIERYQAAQRLLIDDAVAIFYADVDARLVHRSDIEGINLNPAYAALHFNHLRRAQ